MGDEVCDEDSHLQENHHHSDHVIEHIDQQAQQSDAEFASKFEYFTKLGFEEDVVKTTLHRLGPEAIQDDLLAELIKLKKSNPDAQSCCNNNNNNNNSNKTPDGHRTLTASCSAPASNGSPNWRPIVIDGSNVAITHGGDGKTFSCKGIQICVDWFKSNGMEDITVFVPSWRKEIPRSDGSNPITDQHILTELEQKKIVSFTPSRTVAGRRVACHDDLYILNLAVDNGGVVVTNDNYRDIIAVENDKIDKDKIPLYKEVIEKRILPYTLVKDRFMPPNDPYGKQGPSLTKLLAMPSSSASSKTSKIGDSTTSSPPTATPRPFLDPCPFQKKCTFGNKCKYLHPERGNQPLKSPSERLAEHNKNRQQQSQQQRSNKSRETSPGDKNSKLQTPKSLCQTASLPPSLHNTMTPPSYHVSSSSSAGRKQPLMRTKSVVPELISTPVSVVSSTSSSPANNGPLIMRSGQVKSGSYHGHPSAPQHKLHPALLHPNHGSHHHHGHVLSHAPLTTSLSARSPLFGPSSSSCTDFQNNSAFSSSCSHGGFTDQCHHHPHQQPLLQSYHRSPQSHSLSMHHGQQISQRFSQPHQQQQQQPPLCQHHPSHCCVAKRFSDPEKLIGGTSGCSGGLALSGSHDSGFSSKSYSESGESSSPDSTIGAGNSAGFHRKLARQLTLNPTGYDPRVEAITAAFKAGSEELRQHLTSSYSDDKPDLFSDFLSQEQKRHQLPIGSQRQHQPANRLMSEPVTGGSHRQGLLQHPSVKHHSLHQDSVLLPNRSPSPPSIFGPSLFPERQTQPPHSPNASSHGMNAGGPFSGPSIWSPFCGTTTASSSEDSSNINPWSLPDPVSYSTSRSSSEQSHEIPHLSLRSSLPLTSSEVSSSSSCGGQLSTDTSIDSPSASSSTLLIQADRERIFYHLSSLFPESQVRKAMEMHPEEIDAQVICAAIIAFGKE